MQVRRRGVLGEAIVVDMYGFERLTSEVTTGRYGSQKGRIVAIKDLDGPSSEDMPRPRATEERRPRFVTPRPNYPDET